MDIKIKIRIYRHTKKFLQKRFDFTGPLVLKPGSVANDYIKIDFLGRKYENTFHSKDKIDTLEVILSAPQFVKYQKEVHDRDVVRALEDFFKTAIYEFVRPRISVARREMAEAIREFMYKYDLHGEDINMDMMRKKYKRAERKYLREGNKTVLYCTQMEMSFQLPPKFDKN